MQEQTYLIFSLNERRYSIDSLYLEEMLPLPEITRLPSSSPDIVGVLNLRGDIVPILDLNLSLGHEPQPYRTADSVIILKQNQLRVGLIVNRIGELVTCTTLEIDALDSRLQAQQTIARRKAMITGTILSTKTVDAIAHDPPCWLLNEPEQWLRYVEVQQLISISGVLEEDPAIAANLSSDLQPAIFCPEATPEESAIFQQRALSLRQSLSASQPDTRSTLAIVTVGNSYLAVDLAAVKEFTGLQRVTPIPCCPPHIVGNMNLRGEILTLVDIQPCLASTNDSPQASPAAQPPPLSESKVMVIEVDQYTVGVLVKDVLESMFSVQQEEMVSPSSQLPAQIDPRYLQGEFSYRNAPVGILDFPKLLSTGALEIDDVV